MRASRNSTDWGREALYLEKLPQLRGGVGESAGPVVGLKGIELRANGTENGQTVGRPGLQGLLRLGTAGERRCKGESRCGNNQGQSGENGGDTRHDGLPKVTVFK